MLQPGNEVLQKFCECGKICKNNGEFLISGHFTGDVMNCTGYTGIYTYLHDKCVCVCLKMDKLTPIYGCFLSWRKWFGSTVCSNPNMFGVRLVQNFNHASPLAAQNLATLQNLMVSVTIFPNDSVANWWYTPSSDKAIRNDRLLGKLNLSGTWEAQVTLCRDCKTTSRAETNRKVQTGTRNRQLPRKSWICLYVYIKEELPQLQNTKKLSLPSGNVAVCCGKSPCLIGTVNHRTKWALVQFANSCITRW